MENLINKITNTIVTLSDEFTTHELIIQLAKNEQHTYIQALYNHLDSENPFQALHSKIGKHLGQSSHLVTSTSKIVKNVDIFGQSSGSPLWKKIP